MMPKWYRVDGTAWVLDKVGHEAALPAIRCDVCGNTWSIIGCNYPTVDCSAFPDALKRVGPVEAVTPRHFRSLVRAIEPQLEGRPLTPGASFGRLSATLRIPPPSFFESGIDLYLRNDVVADESMRGLGLRLGRFAAKSRSGKSFVLHEVEAWPVAKLWKRSEGRSRSREKAPCSECGFVRTRGYDVAKPTRLKASSLAGVHVASLDIAPATRFISAELKDAIARHRPARSLSFVPVDVVDE